MGLAVGTAKYLLFFFNFIFFITGVLIIAMGAVVKNDTAKYAELDGAEFTSAPVLLIVVGVFVAIISFFGCCGAIKHNYCMLMTFAALLTLIFILELAAGIAAFVRRDEVVKVLGDSMNKTMEDYNKTQSSTDFWDGLQKDEKCCGVRSFTNWTDTIKYIPTSCCNVSMFHDNETKTCNTSDTNAVYQTGCLSWIEKFFHDNIGKIGSIGVGIAFVQILGIVFACCLASAVKDSH